MSDYSDIIYLMVAMVVFSILTTNVSKTLINNDKRLSENEVEYAGIGLAKSLIDQAQWMTKSELNPASSNYKFKTYTKASPDTTGLNLNGIKVDYYTYITVSDTTLLGSNADNKVMKVFVTSPYFYSRGEQAPANYANYKIKLQFIKSFPN